jgi:hypothetical protein
MLPAFDELRQLPMQRRQYLEEALTRLNLAIERKIIESIEGEPSVRQHPNESMIFPLAPFTSSNISDASTTRISKAALDPAFSARDSNQPVIQPSAKAPMSAPSQSTAVFTAVKEETSGPLWRDSMFSRPPSDMPSPSPPISSSQDESDEPLADILGTPVPEPVVLDNILEEERLDTLSKIDTAVCEDIVNLKLGIPHLHIFSANSPPIRFHTRKIHIELSRSCAEDLLSDVADPRASRISEASDLLVEVERITPEYASTILHHDKDIVDLGPDWSEPTIGLPHGIIYTADGLIMRKRSHFVALRASMSHSSCREV